MDGWVGGHHHHHHHHQREDAAGSELWGLFFIEEKKRKTRPAHKGSPSTSDSKSPHSKKHLINPNIRKNITFPNDSKYMRTEYSVHPHCPFTLWLWWVNMYILKVFQSQSTCKGGLW